MKKVHLYLLRHGMTVFNEKNIVQGWCDSLLLEKTVNEAKQLQPKFKELGIDTIYCSPMLRTRQTAMCVCPWIAPKEDARLMEIHYGYLEGESAKTLQLFYPNRYDFENFEGFAGGESWKEAGPRFMEAINDIVNNAKDNEHILIVSHGAIITWFLYQIDRSINTKVPNLSFKHVLYDGTFHIED